MVNFLFTITPVRAQEAGASIDEDEEEFLADPNYKELEESELPAENEEAQKKDDKPAGWDEKTEARFQQQVDQIFKNKGKKKQEDATEIVMPLQYGQVGADLIETRLREGQGLEIDRVKIFKTMRKLASSRWFDRPDIAEELPEGDEEEVKKSDRRWIPLSAINGKGVRLLYDANKLTIRIFVPPDFRKPRAISLSQRGSRFSKKGEKPSLLSGFLNINGTESFQSPVYNSATDGRSPLQLQLDSAVNVGGFVLESYGRYTENRGQLSEENPSFTREDVRLVKDIQSLALRVSVGDLNYPVRANQDFQPMAGISVVSNFGVNPSLLSFPSGNYELFLKKNSKVYVIINDKMVQVLELKAGRHFLRNFPFAAGFNEVRLDIVDDVGRTETVTFSTFSATELLKPGLHQLSYAVGAPSADLRGSRIYDSKALTFSGFHRYGFSESLSLGLSHQTNSTHWVTGVESLFSTSIGYFKLEPAMSSSGGAAVSLRYLTLDYLGPDKTQRTFNLGLGYTMPNFETLNLSRPGLGKGLDLSAGFRQALSRKVSFNFGGSYTFSPKESGADLDDSFNISLGVNRGWDNGISTSFSAQHTRSSGGNDDVAVLVFLVWTMPKESQSISASANTSEGAFRTDWNYSPSSGAESFSYGATLSEDRAAKGYGLQTNYNGNRIRASLNHEVSIDKDNPLSDSETGNEQATARNLSTLQFGTALTYAGGYFSVSRPVTDSFVTFVPVKSLEDQTLIVNPGDNDYYDAKSDWLGRTTVSEIPSYGLTTLEVKGENLPLGVSIPKDHFDLYPTYKSGYAYALGADATIYLIMKITTPDGAPVESAAGRAIRVDDPDESAIAIFTNRKGTVRSEGFRPGKYRFEIATDQFEAIELEIPADAKEEFDFGTIQLKAKPQ